MALANMHALQNLIPLVVFWPLRLCVAPEMLRTWRIIVLKITHAPFVAIIWTFETLMRYSLSRHAGRSANPKAPKGRRAPSSYGIGKRKDKDSKSLGSQQTAGACLPKGPGLPISAGAGSKDVGATHVDSVLKNLAKTLDDMEQNIKRLADAGQNLSESSKNDLVAQIRERKQQWEKLRTMAEMEEANLDDVLTRVTTMAAQE